MRRNRAHIGVFSKLKTKLVALNMACVAVVVVLTFSAICYFDYSNETSEVSQSLSSSINAAAQAAQRYDHKPGASSDGQPASASDANQGPANQNESQPPEAPKETNASENESESTTSTGPEAPIIGGGQGQNIPVAVYSISGDSATPTASPFGTASITSEVLQAAIERLSDESDGSGELADLGLFYEKRTENGTTYLAFADAGSASGWKTLAATLALAAVGVLAAFFVISILFSRWALRPTEEAWRSQRQFIADASHELKTPLTVILANATIALEHPEKNIESQRQWIEGIQAEGQRMQGLVEDMLALAKHDAAEAGMQQTASSSKETLDVSDAARRAVLQFEAVAFERGVEIRDECASNVSICAARADIERVLGVLIDNACKYAGENGSVVVSTKYEGKYAIVRVNNTGAPIPSEELSRVFDRFWRADEARTSGKGGYGLGLSIARSIVEEYGGTLSAESSAEKGTTFTAKFPAKR